MNLFMARLWDYFRCVECRYYITLGESALFFLVLVVFSFSSFVAFCWRAPPPPSCNVSLIWISTTNVLDFEGGFHLEKILGKSCYCQVDYFPMLGYSEIEASGMKFGWHRL